MAEILIHVGWPKAASTFLQRRVFPASGLPFAEVGERFPFGTVAARPIDLVNLEEGFDAEAMRAGFLGDRDALILSQETLSGHLHGYPLIDAERIAGNLARAFPEARILMVTRNQFDYVLSLYAFRVAIRGHETRSLARFVREEAREGLLERIEFHRLAETYERLFGRGRVLALPMEMLARDPAAFLGRLSDFAGWPPGKLSVPPRRGGDGRRVNESTRTRRTLIASRSLNAVFGLALRARARRDGLGRDAFDPRQQAWPPYRPMRQAFYDFKRRTTARMERFLPAGGTIGPEDMGSAEELRGLRARFAASNRRLADLAACDWSPEAWGYPWNGTDGARNNGD